MVATRDAELAATIALLRFHGMDREAWDRFGKKGSQHYEIIRPGFKYNMMDMQAALGIHQLKALDGFIARRTELARRYQARLAGRPELDRAAGAGVRPPPCLAPVHGAHQPRDRRLRP